MTLPRIAPDTLRAPLFVDDAAEAARRLDEIRAMTRARATASLDLTRPTPAPAARVTANTGRAFGITPDAVPAGLTAPSPFAAFVQDDPPLARWLSNPSNAGQAHDDLSSLTSLSWLLKQKPTAIQAPSALQRTATVFGASFRQNTELVDGRWNQMVGGVSPEEHARLNTLSAYLSKQQQEAGADLPGVVNSAAQTAPSIIRGLSDSGAGIAAGMTIGGAVGLAGGPFAEVTVPVGLAVGAYAGNLAGTFTSTLRSEGALALDQLLQAKTAAGNDIDEGTARRYAWGIGLVNALIETTGEVFLLKYALPGVSAAVSRTIRGAAVGAILKKATATSVESAIAAPTTRAALAGFARSWGATMAEESLTEAAQSVAPGLANVALNVATGDDAHAYRMADVAKDMLDSGVQAFEAMTVLGFPVPFANMAAQHVHIAKAQQTAQYFEALHEAAKSSKLIGEAPETMADAIRQSAPDAPTVYVPAEAWATFFQERGVAPEQAAQEILGDAGQYVTAASLGGVGTGGLIAIPMDVYATKLAGGAFHAAMKSDLTLNPSDLSERAAATLAKESASPEAITRMLDEMQAALPVAVDGEEVVRQEVSAKLQAAGVTPAQAAPLGRLHGLVYRSLATRSQQTVADLQAQRDVRIVGGREAQRANTPSVPLAPDGLPRNLAALSAPDFDTAFARTAALREQDYAAAHLIPENVLTAVQQEGAAGKEDLRGAIEAAGYTVEEWNDAQASMAKAKFRLTARDKSVARLEAEQARRADGGIVQGSARGGDIYDGAPLTQSGPQLNADGMLVDENGVVLFQSAFHGTPHRFDKFSTQHIGSGEGAQVYGYGLYFASRKEIAEAYREKLVHDSPTLLRGGGDLLLKIAALPSIADETKQEGAARFAAEATTTPLEAAMVLAAIKERGFGSDARGDAPKMLRAAVSIALSDSADRISSDTRSARATFVEEASPGQLYEVSVPEDHELLSWDAPLSEQPKAIRDVFVFTTTKNPSPAASDEKWVVETTIGGESFDLNAFPTQREARAVAANVNGRQVYESIALQRGPRATSALLAAQGIKGIRYLDGGSRTAGDGTHNYVIFNDQDVAIQRTFYQEPIGAPVDGTQARLDPRGFIQFTEGGHKVTIGLLKDANESTFIHESAHLFAEMVLDTATRDGASEQLRADAQIIRDWLGVPTGPLNTEQHEQFARGFESYFETATAPTPELASLFGRFRRWMASVYKSLGGLNIPLSDDVRGVFDRLIAGEDAIAKAEADVQAGRFTAPEQGQMTPEQFATYQAHGTVTAEAFAAELQARLRAETVRETRAEWKAEVAQRTADLTASLSQEPVYRALDALQTEKLPRQWVEDHFGPDARKILTQKRLTAVDGTVDPSVFAVEHGFATEGDLIEALIVAPKLSTVVGLQVKADMAREHGSLLNDSPALARATQEALHEAAGDSMAQLLTMELEALGRVRGIEVPRSVGGTPLTTITRLAKETISRQQIATLRPQGYLVAERKAAKEVEAALASGSQAEAYTSKRRQLLNHVLYREAVAAQTEAREARATLVSFTTTAVRAKIGKVGAVWLDQIDGLLERVDLKSRTRDEQQAIADLRAFIAERNNQDGAPASFNPIVQTLALAPDLPSVPYQQFTIDQMRDLRDAVLTLAAGARQEGKATALSTALSREGIQTQLKADIDATSVRSQAGGDAMSSAVKRAAAIRRTAASLRTLPSLLRQFGGGNETSGWASFLLHPLNAASVAEVGRLREVGAAFESLNRTLTKSDRAHLSRVDFFYTSTKSQQRIGLTVRQRLAVALNAGTDGNLQRLRDGNGMSNADVQRVLDSLSDTQLQWVQGVRDLLDGLWPETEALAKRLDGVAPTKVEASAYIVRGTQYRGGYYRIKYDPTQDGRANVINDASQAKDYVLGTAFRSSTKNGSRIERLEKVSSPLRLDLRVIDEHLTEVIHDLTHAEVIRDINGVLRGPDMAQFMVDTVGPEQWAAVKESLKDVVRNGRPLEQGSALAEKFSRHVSAFGIGFNLLSGAINVTNYTSSVQRIGPTWVLRGLYSTFANSAKMESTRQLVFAKSEFMQQRGVRALRNAGEAISDTFDREGIDPVLRAINTFSYSWMGLTQQMVDIPSWLGAYQKGIAQGLTEETAVHVADQAIIDAQGSSAVKDLSLAMRQRGAARLFTTLYSYMNTQYNLLSVENRLTLQGGTRLEKVAGLTANALLAIVLPAVLSKLVRDLIRDGEPDDTPESYAAEVAAYSLSLVPGFREVAGVFQGFSDYEGPAGVRLASATTKFALAAKKSLSDGEINGSTLRAANQALGLFFGYPGVQLDRTVRGIGALIDGTTANPLAVFTGPPRRSAR